MRKVTLAQFKANAHVLMEVGLYRQRLLQLSMGKHYCMPAGLEFASQYDTVCRDIGVRRMEREQQQYLAQNCQ